MGVRAHTLQAKVGRQPWPWHIDPTRWNKKLLTIFLGNLCAAGFQQKLILFFVTFATEDFNVSHRHQLHDQAG